MPLFDIVQISLKIIPREVMEQHKNKVCFFLGIFEVALSTAVARYLPVK